MTTSAPATPPEGGATQTPTPTPTPAPRGRRRTRRAAIVIAILGLVGSVVLAIGVLVGRAWVSTEIGGLVDDAHQAVARSGNIADEISSRTAQRASDLQLVLSAAAGADANAPVPTALSGPVSGLIAKYDAVRDRYVDIREKLRSVLGTLNRMQRFIPGLEIPSGAQDALTELDQRLVAFDDNLGQLRASAAASGTLKGVVEATTALGATLDVVSDLSGRIKTRTDDLQQRIEQAHTRLDLYLWLGAGGILLVILYVALLNIFVILLARD